MKVPQMQRQVEEVTPKVQIPNYPEPLRAAFGENVWQGNQAIAEGVSSLAGAIIKRNVEKQKEEAEREVYQLRNEYNNEKTKRLYSDDEEEFSFIDPVNGTEQKLTRKYGLMNNNGYYTQGSNTAYADWHRAKTEELMSRTKYKEQQAMLWNMLNNDFNSENEKITRHMATQQQKARIEIADTTVKTLVKDSYGLDNVDAISNKMNEAIQAQAYKDNQVGADPVTALYNQNEVKKSVINSAIKGSLEADQTGIQAHGILDAFRPYGKREDGTDKGSGYFGELKTKDGKVATELSVGVELDGKEVLIPTLVPTLTEEEKQFLLDGGKPTKAIIEKAVEHAKTRMSEGKSPFAEDKASRLSQEDYDDLSRQIKTDVKTLRENNENSQKLLDFNKAISFGEAIANGTMTDKNTVMEAGLSPSWTRAAIQAINTPEKIALLERNAKNEPESEDAEINAFREMLVNFFEKQDMKSLEEALENGKISNRKKAMFFQVAKMFGDPKQQDAVKQLSTGFKIINKTIDEMGIDNPGNITFDYFTATQAGKSPVEAAQIATQNELIRQQAGTEKEAVLTEKIKTASKENNDIVPMKNDVGNAMYQYSLKSGKTPEEAAIIASNISQMIEEDDPESLVKAVDKNIPSLRFSAPELGKYFDDMVKFTKNIVPNIGKAIKRSYEGLKTGAERQIAGTPQLIGAMAENVGDKLQSVKPMFLDISTPIGKELSRIGRVMDVRNKAIIQKKYPEAKNVVDKYIQDIGAGGVSIAASLGLGVITGGGAAPGVAFGAYQKFSKYQQLMEKQRRKGEYKPDESESLSNLYGFVEGGLEFWGVDKFLKITGGVLKSAAKRSTTEFIQEYSQQTGESTLDVASSLRPNEGFKTVKDIVSESLYAGSIGFVLGAPSSIAVGNQMKSDIKTAFTEIGMSDRQADKKADELMTKFTEEEIVPKLKEELNSELNKQIDEDFRIEDVLAEDTGLNDVSEEELPPDEGNASEEGANIKKPVKPTEGGGAVNYVNISDIEKVKEEAKATKDKGIELPSGMKTSAEDAKTAEDFLKSNPNATADDYLNQLRTDEIVGYRYGDAPEGGKSYNTKEQKFEQGVSLASAMGQDEIGSFAVSGAKGRKKKYYRGKKAGTGGDDEYLITDIKEITKEEYDKSLMDKNIIGERLKDEKEKLNLYESLRRRGYSPMNTDYGLKKIETLKKSIKNLESHLISEFYEAKKGKGAEEQPPQKANGADKLQTITIPKSDIVDAGKVEYIIDKNGKKRVKVSNRPAKVQPIFTAEERERLQEVEDQSYFWEAGGKLIEGTNPENGRKQRSPSTFGIKDVGLRHRDLTPLFDNIKKGKPLTQKQIDTAMMLLEYNKNIMPVEREIENVAKEISESEATEAIRAADQEEPVIKQDFWEEEELELKQEIKKLPPKATDIIRESKTSIIAQKRLKDELGLEYSIEQIALYKAMLFGGSTNVGAMSELEKQVLSEAKNKQDNDTIGLSDLIGEVTDDFAKELADRGSLLERVKDSAPAFMQDVVRSGTLVHNVLLYDKNTQPIAESVSDTIDRQNMRIKAIDNIVIKANKLSKEKDFNKQKVSDWLIDNEDNKNPNNSSLSESEKAFVEELSKLRLIVREALQEEILRKNVGVRTTFLRKVYNIEYINKEGKKISRPEVSIKQIEKLQKDGNKVIILSEGKTYSFKRLNLKTGQYEESKRTFYSDKEYSKEVENLSKIDVDSLLPYKNWIAHYRKGKYWVIIEEKLPSGETEEVFATLTETLKQAEYIKEQLKNKPIFNVKVVKKSPNVTTVPKMSSMLEIADFLVKSGVDPKSDAGQKIMNRYRSMSSFMSHLIKRKGIPGFSTDVDMILRGMEDAALSAERRRFRNELGDVKDLLADVQDIRKKDLANKYINALASTQDHIQWLALPNKLMYFKALHNSTANAVQNMTEVFNAMSAVFDFVDNPKDFAEIMATKIDEDMKKLIQRAYDESVINPLVVFADVSEDILAKTNFLGNATEAWSTAKAFEIGLKTAKKLGLKGEEMYSFAKRFKYRAKPLYNQANASSIFYYSDNPERLEAVRKHGTLFLRFFIDLIDKLRLGTAARKMMMLGVYFMLSGLGGFYAPGRGLAEKLGIDITKDPKDMTIGERMALGGVLAGAGVDTNFLRLGSLKTIANVMNIKASIESFADSTKYAMANAKKYDGIDKVIAFGAELAPRGVASPAKGYLINKYGETQKRGKKSKIIYYPETLSEKGILYSGLTPFNLGETRRQIREARAK